MYVQRNNIATRLNNFCHVKATVYHLRIVDVHVSVNDIKVLSVVMER
jgi:hypothetical protein